MYCNTKEATNMTTIGAYIKTDQAEDEIRQNIARCITFRETELNLHLINFVKGADHTLDSGYWKGIFYCPDLKLYCVVSYNCGILRFAGNDVKDKYYKYKGNALNALNKRQPYNCQQEGWECP